MTLADRRLPNKVGMAMPMAHQPQTHTPNGFGKRMIDQRMARDQHLQYHLWVPDMAHGSYMDERGILLRCGAAQAAAPLCARGTRLRMHHPIPRTPHTVCTARRSAFLLPVVRSSGSVVQAPAGTGSLHP
eukprot:7325336-Prymnesium_polylepis.1